MMVSLDAQSPQEASLGSGHFGRPESRSNNFCSLAALPMGIKGSKQGRKEGKRSEVRRRSLSGGSSQDVGEQVRVAPSSPCGSILPRQAKYGRAVSFPAFLLHKASEHESQSHSSYRENTHTSPGKLLGGTVDGTLVVTRGT